MIKQPRFEITYNGVDITEDISSMVERIDYNDRVSGQMDDIDLMVDDTDFLWSNAWYPDQGARLSVRMGYKDKMFPTGTFEIDEISFSSNPERVNIRAVSAPVSGSVRTKRTQRYENQYLSNVVSRVAARNGFSVVGQFGSVVVERETQNKENDMRFLNRLAKKYGHVFNVRGDTLVFTSIYALEAAEPKFTLDRVDLVRFSITDKLDRVYSSSRVRYTDPKTGETIEQTDEESAGVANEDVAESWQRTASESQAREIARAILHQNTLKVNGFIEVEGNTAMLAGNNIELTGMGRLSGIYHILGSSHRISSAGYVTSCDVKRVRDGSGQTAQRNRI